MVEALRGAGCSSFGHFDILGDAEVREGLKAFSNWPTYPQLYVRGELLGGCDIVLEMAGSGELKTAVEAATAVAAAAAAPALSLEEAVNARIKALLASAPVMLFMKGARSAMRAAWRTQAGGTAVSRLDVARSQARRRSPNAASAGAWWRPSAPRRCAPRRPRYAWRSPC